MNTDKSGNIMAVISSTTCVFLSSDDYDALPTILRRLAEYVEQNAVTIEDISVQWDEFGVHVAVYVDGSELDAELFFESEVSAWKKRFGKQEA